MIICLLGVLDLNSTLVWIIHFPLYRFYILWSSQSFIIIFVFGFVDWNVVFIWINCSVNKSYFLEIQRLILLNRGKRRCTLKLFSCGWLCRNYYHVLARLQKTSKINKEKWTNIILCISYIYIYMYSSDLKLNCFLFAFTISYVGTRNYLKRNVCRITRRFNDFSVKD